MISAAEAQLVGCPLPASVVERTESIRKRVALSCSVCNATCSEVSTVITSLLRLPRRWLLGTVAPLLSATVISQSQTPRCRTRERNRDDTMAAGPVQQTACSLFTFEFLESRSLVHGQMVGRVAFDQILRFLLRGADRVALERDGRGDLLLDRSPDVACFRVPPHLISNFKVLLHRPDL